jgi:hypothetical protein
MAATRSKAGVKVAACSEIRDEAAACFETKIEDRRQWRHRRQAMAAGWYQS